MYVPRLAKLLLKATVIILTILSFYFLTIPAARANPAAWADKVVEKLIGLLGLAYGAIREIRRGDGGNGGELALLVLGLVGALLGIGGEILANPGIATFGWLIFLGGSVGVAVLEYMRPVSPPRVGMMEGPAA